MALMSNERMSTSHLGIPKSGAWRTDTWEVLSARTLLREPTGHRPLVSINGSQDISLLFIDISPSGRRSSGKIGTQWEARI